MARTSKIMFNSSGESGLPSKDIVLEVNIYTLYKHYLEQIWNGRRIHIVFKEWLLL